MELSAKRCGWVKARVLVVDACDYAPSVFLSHATAAVHSSSPARSASSLNFVLPGISFAADCSLPARGIQRRREEQGRLPLRELFFTFQSEKRGDSCTEVMPSLKKQRE